MAARRAPTPTTPIAGAGGRTPPRAACAGGGKCPAELHLRRHARLRHRFDALRHRRRATSTAQRRVRQACAVDATAAHRSARERLPADAYPEVTVARFRFLPTARAAAPRCASPPVAYPGGSTVPWIGVGREPHQAGRSTGRRRRARGATINGVDFWTALEFCVWDGGRLPTEVEGYARARPPARLVALPVDDGTAAAPPTFARCALGEWRRHAPGGPP